MGLTPLKFSGLSTYSQDFGKILERAQTIAAFPLNSLRNQKTDLLSQKTLTGTLQTLVTSLTTAAESLAEVGDRNGITGSSSNTSKVVINTVTATNSATFRLTDITSVAVSASETSVLGYSSSTAAAVSATGSVRLTVGGETYDIALTPDENNLVGLQNKINSLGAGVTASIFTTGTGATPNYLSVTADTTGARTVSLTDDPGGAATALLTANNQGSDAVFKLNGVNVSKSSNSINDVVPGLAFTIVGTTTGAESVTVTLSKGRAELASKLQAFAQAYNDVSDFLDSQIGEDAGLLTGSSLILRTQEELRALVNFDGAGTIRSLSALGLVLDQQGTLTFDEEIFDQVSDSSLDDAFEFVGTSSAGIGSRIASLETLSDSVTGIIQLELDQYETTELRLSSQIDALTDRINRQTAVLEERLQIFDALLSTLEAQQSRVTASIDALNLTVYGKRDS
jgi:flagellar hook-associated protein 2